MISAWITPKIILLGSSLNLGLWLAIQLPGLAGGAESHGLAASALKTVALCLAYTMTLALNLEVAATYRQARWLRMAWLGFGANAGFSVIKVVVESKFINQIWPGYTGSQRYSLLQQLAIAPANAVLLVSLLALLWAYTRISLGFAMEGRYYAAIGGILALTISLLLLLDGLDTCPPCAFIRYLRQISLGLLALSAAASIVTHRMAVQMGGGGLTLVLQCLVLYTLLQAALILAQALYRIPMPELLSPSSDGYYFFNLCWQLVPWIAAFAAASAQRAQLMGHVA